MPLKKLLIIGLVMTVTAMQFTFAYAVDAAAVSAPEVYEINLTDAAIAVVGVLFSLLLGAVAWITNKTAGLISKYLHINIDDKTRAYLETALRQGILYAEKHAKTKISKGVKAPTTEDMRIALAADYVLQRVPDAIKHFKLERDSLVQMIEARLDEKPEGDPEAEEKEEAELSNA